jgi:hypothetical protein
MLGWLAIMEATMLIVTATGGVSGKQSQIANVN